MLLRILSYFLNSRFYSKLRSEVVTRYSKLEKLKLWTVAFYKVANSPNSWFLKWNINFWHSFNFHIFVWFPCIGVRFKYATHWKVKNIVSWRNINWKSDLMYLKFSDNIYHVLSQYHWMYNFTFYFKILVFRFYKVLLWYCLDFVLAVSCSK